MGTTSTMTRIATVLGLAVLLLGLFLGLVGCSLVIPDPVVAEEGYGNDHRTRQIKGLGMAAVTDGEGVAVVVGTLINVSDQTDRLIDVEADSERGPVRAVLARQVPLPQRKPVQLARADLLDLISDHLVPGRYIRVTFTFAKSPTLEMLVPVERHRGVYSEIEVTRPPDGDVGP